METRITCKLADSKELRSQVYRLRHDCYLRRGAIEARADGAFSDSYDELANHFSFLLSTEMEPALGTVRISVVRPDLNWHTAPVKKVFGDHPAFAPIASRSFVEASRLCFGQQARREVLFELVAHMAALADFYEVDWLVACPREEHTQIYQRMFGFRQLAEPRQYFGVNFRTALLAVEREQLRKRSNEVKWMRDAWIHASSRVTKDQNEARAY